jgi:SAM-dependent methyltransferase
MTLFRKTVHVIPTPELKELGCYAERASFEEMKDEAAALIRRKTPAGLELLPWKYGAMPFREDALVENPSRVVAQNIRHLGDVEGKVFLDVGAGLGRDTFFLLRRGAEVYTLDKDGDVGALREKWAKRLKLPGKLHTITSDLRDFRGDTMFDGVISSISLWAALTKQDASDFIHYAQDHTKVGGINLIAALTTKNRENPRFARSQIFFTTASQLKGWYFGSWHGLHGRPHGVWQDLGSGEDSYMIQDGSFPMPHRPGEMRRHTINISARKTG